MKERRRKRRKTYREKGDISKRVVGERKEEEERKTDGEKEISVKG